MKEINSNMALTKFKDANGNTFCPVTTAADLDPVQGVTDAASTRDDGPEYNLEDTFDRLVLTDRPEDNQELGEFGLPGKRTISSQSQNAVEVKKPFRGVRPPPDFSRDTMTIQTNGDLVDPQNLASSSSGSTDFLHTKKDIQAQLISCGIYTSPLFQTQSKPKRAIGPEGAVSLGSDLTGSVETDCAPTYSAEDKRRISDIEKSLMATPSGPMPTWNLFEGSDSTLGIGKAVVATPCATLSGPVGPPPPPSTTTTMMMMTNVRQKHVVKGPPNMSTLGLKVTGPPNDFRPGLELTRDSGLSGSDSSLSSGSFSGCEKAPGSATLPQHSSASSSLPQGPTIAATVLPGSWLPAHPVNRAPSVSSFSSSSCKSKDSGHDFSPAGSWDASPCCSLSPTSESDCHSPGVWVDPSGDTIASAVAKSEGVRWPVPPPAFPQHNVVYSVNTQPESSPSQHTPPSPHQQLQSLLPQQMVSSPHHGVSSSSVLHQTLHSSLHAGSSTPQHTLASPRHVASSTPQHMLASPLHVASSTPQHRLPSPLQAVSSAAQHTLSSPLHAVSSPVNQTLASPCHQGTPSPAQEIACNPGRNQTPETLSDLCPFNPSACQVTASSSTHVITSTYISQQRPPSPGGFQSIPAPSVISRERSQSDITIFGELVKSGHCCCCCHSKLDVVCRGPGGSAETRSQPAELSQEHPLPLEVLQTACDEHGVWREDEDGDTILHVLPVWKNQEVAISNLIMLKNLPGFLMAVNKYNKKSETPLYNAVCFGKVRLVAAFLSLGANVNMTCHSVYQTTPLHHAVEKCDVSMVDTLLRCPYIDIDFRRPSDRCTPLLVALMRHIPNHPRDDCLEIIKKLVKAEDKPDFKAVDMRSGKTVMMCVVETKDPRVLDLILSEVGLDEARNLINMTNRVGNSAVHLAAGLHDEHVKELMLRKLIWAGGETNKKNCEGESPKDWARNVIDKVAKFR